MKKIRLIELCLTLVVMVAMTSTASALFDIQVGDGSLIKMKPGDSLLFDITVSGFTVDTSLNPPLNPVSFTDPREVNIDRFDVTCLSSPCAGLSVIDVTLLTPFFATDDPFTLSPAVTFSMADPNPDDIGTQYEVTLFGEDNTIIGRNYIEVLDYDGAGVVPVENIPEFPTVALPIAATIGLLFFFRYNKRKDEK